MLVFSSMKSKNKIAKTLLKHFLFKLFTSLVLKCDLCVTL